MRRERPTRHDDEDEPHVSLRDRMTRLEAELVEAREVLERVAPGEPRLLAPATVAEAFAMADAALAAKARENVRVHTTISPTRHDTRWRDEHAPTAAALARAEGRDDATQLVRFFRKRTKSSVPFQTFSTPPPFPYSRLPEQRIALTSVRVTL
jgi:hypothetical protein